MMRDWLSPSNCVRRKLSALAPAAVFEVGVVACVGPLADGAFPENVFHDTPSGWPPVDAGLKYGEFSAFSISMRISADTLPRIRTRFTALRSNRTRRGALTTRLRRPQS